MADIDLERKKSGTPWWLWLLLGLIVLALLLWWLWPDADDELEYEAEPVVMEEEMEPIEPVEPMAAAAGIPIGEILANPEQWIGRSVDGEVTVDEVPTDRGFWVTDDQGQRLFALVVDQPEEQPLDINRGQTVELNGVTVHDAAEAGDVEGRPLTGATQQIVDGEEVFLLTRQANMQIVEEGTGMP